MARSKQNTFEKWQEAVYSGKYIHPVTEKNMPSTPPIKEIEPEFGKAQPIPLPGKKDPKLLVVTFVVLICLLVGYFTYVVATSQNPRQTLTAPIDHATAQIDYIVEGVISGLAHRVAELIPEPKVKVIRDYRPAQNAAIAKIKAWEKVHMKIVDEHYNSKVLQGKRILCIAMGDKKDCNTIYVEPKTEDLPDFQPL